MASYADKVESCVDFTTEDEIKVFLTQASEKEFRQQFPGYKDSRENFDYSLHAKEGFEKQLNLKPQAYDEYTIRECRRSYKIALSQQHKKWAEAREDIQGEMKNCYRCMLIQQGTLFIPDNSIHPCGISAPKDGVIKEDQMYGDASIEQPTDQAYQLTLSASTSLSSTVTEIAVCHDDPFPKIIEEHRLTTQRKLIPVNPNHICRRFNKKMARKTANLELLSEGSTEAEHKLIYAPIAFGKTSLQHAAMRRGVSILDTDDTPGTTDSILDIMIGQTTVLTNRLDLAKQTSKSVIFFTTSSWEKLKERVNIQGISDDDWKIWWESIEEEAKRGLKCVSDTKFMTDWFKWQDTPPEVLTAWRKAESTAL
uniref:Uncharacterized protein n=1 Tax=Graphocephala atropunctata TaxID=36148 RepID=A0A1B6L796_9HEMI